MPLSINQGTARFVKVFSAIALSAGVVFFVYSAFAGTFLGGGSAQVFTGLACLFILLASSIIIEEVVLHTDGE
jgi:Na+/pantothenate symporter